MNILAPCNRMDSIGELIESGVREFYLGFYEEEWRSRFGAYSDINRLTMFKDKANRYTLADLEEITRQIHAAGGSVYITLNAPGYLKQQTELLKQYLETLAGYGVDGVIAGVLELIPLIRSYGLNAVASTMCGINNVDLAAIYRDAGAKRLILPRDLSIAEITQIVTGVPDVEYEAFLMRNGCRYSDANCLGIHGGECGAFCSSVRSGVPSYATGKPPYLETPEDSYWRQAVLDVHDVVRNSYHTFACGQCAIWTFLYLGISAVKIVGRMDAMSDIAADARLTAENIQIAATCATKEEYLQKMKMPGEADSYCRYGLSCYYPEERGWNY